MGQPHCLERHRSAGLGLLNQIYNMIGVCKEDNKEGQKHTHSLTQKVLKTVNCIDPVQIQSTCIYLHIDDKNKVVS